MFPLRSKYLPAMTNRGNSIGQITRNTNVHFASPESKTLTTMCEPSYCKLVKEMMLLGIVPDKLLL